MQRVHTPSLWHGLLRSRERLPEYLSAKNIAPTEILALTAEAALLQTLETQKCEKVGENLHHRRKRRRLTQVQLAKLIKSSQSRVAKMERGDPAVSIDLLIRSHLALGASNRDLAEVISSSRDSSSH